MERKIRVKDLLKNSKTFFLWDLLIRLPAHNLPLALAYLLKIYFDSRGGEAYLKITLLYCLLFGLELFLINLGAKVDIRAQHSWYRLLVEKILAEVEKNPPSSKKAEEDLLDLIKEDLPSIVGAISYGIDTATNVLGLIIAFIIMARINLYISLGLLLIPIMIFFISQHFKEEISQRAGDIRKLETETLEKYKENIDQARIIRINSQEKERMEEYEALLDEGRKKKTSYAKWKNLISLPNNFLVELDLILILRGFKLSGQASPGNIALFISYSFAINDLATYIYTLVILSREVGVNLENLNQKLADLEIEGSKKEVPQGIMEKIENGRVNVIIGENGSGKTALLRGIREDFGGSLLKAQPSIIKAGLKTNICLDKEGPAYEKLVEDLDLMPLEGRDILDQDQISGGQAFRIGLARSLLNSQDLLLIDSNFYSVSSKQREKILDILEESGKTIVFTDSANREEYKDYKKIFL